MLCLLKCVPSAVPPRITNSITKGEARALAAAQNTMYTRQSVAIATTSVEATKYIITKDINIGRPMA